MSTAVKIGIGVLVVAAAVAAGFGGAQVAAAQRAAITAAQSQVAPAPAPRGINPIQPGPGRGPMMGGRRDGRGFGRGQALGGLVQKYRDQIHAATAQALGLSTQDLDKELASGKTLGQIAAEKNITPQDFRTKFAEAMADVLKQAVAAGDLTQAQADALLAHIKTGAWPGMMGGFGPHMGRGGSWF